MTILEKMLRTKLEMQDEPSQGEERKRFIESFEEVERITENKRFKLIDNHLIKYDGDYFDLHKPSDSRTLIKVLNYVTNENEQLKQTIDDLTSEFEGYHKSLEKTKDYDKQFEVTSCPYEIRNNKSNDYYWLEHKGNVTGICKVLNEQSEKINKLEKQIADDFNQSNCITVQKSIIDDLKKENEQLKYENRLFSEELEQCKAVINKKWSEYLQKKEVD